MHASTLLSLLPLLAALGVGAAPAKRACAAATRVSASSASASSTTIGTPDVAAAFQVSGSRGYSSSSSSSSSASAAAAVTSSAAEGASIITSTITIHTTHSHSASDSVAAAASAVTTSEAVAVALSSFITGASSAATSLTAGVAAAIVNSHSHSHSRGGVFSSSSSAAAAATTTAAVSSSAAGATNTKAATSTSVTTSATTAVASTSTAASTGSSSGGKVGLGFDDTGYADLASFTGLDWYYNWGLTSFGVGSAEFVPCVWGSVMAGQVGSTAFPSGTEYTLGFNEPDMDISVGGSGIAAAEAATLHQTWTAALTSDLKIGAPAVARGSTTWFNDWITACDGKCDFDFVPIHFYGTDASQLISYVQSFPAQGKPIWVTEFACVDFGTTPTTYCTADETTTFMNTAIEWFRGDGAAYVDRWAWFGAMPKWSGYAFGLEAADQSPNAMADAYLTL